MKLPTLTMRQLLGVLVAALMAALYSGDVFAQDEKILLLTYQVQNSDPARPLPVHAPPTEQHGSPTIQIPLNRLVQNLVLYLYTPLGSRPIIERAAITIGNDTVLGDEVQELTELRGTEFYRADFQSPEDWLRDVNFDGYSDLILPSSRDGNSKNVYLYQPSSKRYLLDQDGEYLAEPRIVESVALSQNHPTLLR